MRNAATVREALNIDISLTDSPRLVRIPLYVNHLSMPGGLSFGMAVPSSLPSNMLPYLHGTGTL